MGSILDVWCTVCTDLQGFAVPACLAGIVCGVLRVHWLRGARKTHTLAGGVTTADTLLRGARSVSTPAERDRGQR